MPAPATKPGKQRANLRRLVAAHSELVLALDQLYPSLPPSLDDSERLVWAKAGERRLVDHLLTLLRESNERGNLLED